MNAKRILIAALVLAAAALAVNQWRLQRAVRALSLARPETSPDTSNKDQTDDKLRQAEAQLNDAKMQLELAAARLASANGRIAELDNRLSQLEGGTSRRPRSRTGIGTTDDELPIDPNAMTNIVKRSWGPEQAAGEPDTLQGGDISTAWASLEQDGGEEWLKLEYEQTVDIAEVRVRETYNPGAVSKITAFLSNGSEITLWEGSEPQAAAPVEMSFQVPSNASARSIKVYLDTKRVAGWNEIDAVELIGRDGSHQWAKHVTASSTYAEQNVANRVRGLGRF
ncbi:MAG TPA: hypothetical protein VK846_00100 [Candidatus Limnocylindria bacterium]|nr:hypothetical protein [Candidatus Limnocylindria bacterium]